jgi:hypothetical protein
VDHSIGELSNDQALTCLPQWFPIEFNSTHYISQQKERKKVEGHMQVCLKIDATFETMTTMSLSEPTLSEVTYFIIQCPEGIEVSHGRFLDIERRLWRVFGTAIVDSHSQ